MSYDFFFSFLSDIRLYRDIKLWRSTIDLGRNDVCQSIKVGLAENLKGAGRAVG